MQYRREAGAKDAKGRAARFDYSRKGTQVLS